MAKQLAFQLPTLARRNRTYQGTLKALLQVITDQLAIELPTKDVVLKRAGEAFDHYIAPLDIPYIPEPFESKIFDPLARKYFLTLVSAIYDQAKSKLAAKQKAA